MTVLRSRGVNALATPAIERIAAPLPRAVENAISTARGAAREVVVLLTSARAAELAASSGPLRALTFAALEPTTADAARRLGLALEFTSSGGLHDLARACVAWLDARAAQARPLVLHPTSDAGLARDDALALEGVLAARADLVRFPLYETRAHPALADTLGALALPRARYVVTSPSTVHALADVPHPRAIAALCRGASTESAWRERLAHECAPTLVDRSASLEDAIAQYDAAHLRADLEEPR